MASYRLYWLDGAGMISLADDVDASDDAEAVAKAREKHHGARKCEIWKGDRLVATLNAGELGADVGTR